MIDPSNISLSNFVATWHGPATRDPDPAPPSTEWLPQALHEWHYLASQRNSPLTFTTSMISPQEIRAGVDGKATFMVDATADWSWSFDIHNPDAVYEAERHEAWALNPEQLAQFLVHNATREAIYAAPARLSAYFLPDRALAEVLEPLEEVAFGRWNWPAPGYRIFMADDMLVEIVHTRGGSAWDIEVATLKTETLSRLRTIPDADWRTPGA